MLSVMLIMEATDGGTGRYLQGVVPALCKAGVDVHVVCAARRNPDFRAVMAMFRQAGARVTEIDMFREIRPIKDLRSLWPLWRCLRRENPDVIHVHSSKAGALGRLAAKLAGKGPVVYTPHAFAFLERSTKFRSGVYLLLEWILSCWTDYLIAVSDSERQVALKHRLLPPHLVTAVANGLEILPTAEEVSSARQIRELQPSPLRLGYLGRLEVQKAPTLLIQVAAALKRLGVDFRLDIGGQGRLLPQCQRFCAAEGLTEQVKFFGHVEDIQAFYGSIDVFLLTANYEGLPYALLDAMAWELPVVAFDVDGVRDAVVHGQTGLLARAGSIDELAGHIARLASEPDLRREMGRAGRQRVRERFQLRQQVQELKMVYEKLTPLNPPLVRGEVPLDALKVLFVSHCGRIGGAERSMLELMRELDRKQVELFLACPAPSPLAEEAAKIAHVLPVPLYRIDRPGGLGYMLRVAADLARITIRMIGLIRRHRIELVHANSTIAQIWVGPAARCSRIPCIWHWRDFYDYPRFNRVLAKTAVTSIAISHAVRDFAAGQIGTSEKLYLVQNGVADLWDSITEDRPGLWRNCWGLTDQHVLVAILGQLIPRKGHEVLIRALARGIQKNPHLRLVLAYPEPGRDSALQLRKLKDLTHELGCTKEIIFNGYCEDVAGLLRDADIVAVPSLREPFGRVAVEAMLAKRPVIASGIDGLAEIVVDGETGMLVSPGEQDSLAEAMAYLAEYPDVRCRMGRAGRQRALKYFSSKRVASETLDLYHRLLVDCKI